MPDSLIRVLPPDTARKIAAGEVIDRPAAIVRELLDNALDSGASSITVEIEGGGIDLVRVVDDGLGMGPHDLRACILDHATSKISDLDDLLRLSTLGFRGEALASMAAVARLEIVSATRDGVAHRLLSRPAREPTVEPYRGRPGTAVTVEGLFAEIPARKKFLSRANSESALCKTVLVDKAMAHPSVEFRLVVDRRLSLFLPAGTDVDRVAAAQGGDRHRADFFRAEFSGAFFRGAVVAAHPSNARPDRRHTQVFVNRRRIQDYALQTALDDGFSGFLPGGLHPVAFAFIDVDPSEADFNIHPAKREARIRKLSEVRAAIVGAVRGALADSKGSGASPVAVTWGSGMTDAAPKELWASDVTVPYRGDSARPAPNDRAQPWRDERATWDAIATLSRTVRDASSGAESDAPPSDRISAEPMAAQFRYIGRALGVFLAFEMDDSLWLLDQHAAHERMLFDGLSERHDAVQELLVPFVFEPASDDEDAYIAANAEALARAGFRLERDGSSWLLTALPALLGDDVGAVVSLVRERPDPGALSRAARATIACRAAVKDGDVLDECTATALIAGALALPEQRCPHGRPILVRLPRDELYKAVRRLVR